MELVGTFTDSSGTIVGTPFAIGDSSTLVVPAGATQLELGVNDAGYFNDGGSLSIEVSGSPASPSPPFVAPGGQVQLSAQVQSVLNQPQSDTISYTVMDPNGNTVFTSSPVPLPLGISSALTTVDLGTLDTTGLALGVYALVATIFDSSGNPIPNSAGQGSLSIGLPVTASIATTPTTVPTGSDTVTTTVQVQATTTFPSPLTLLGQVSTQDEGISTVLYSNGALSELAFYTAGFNGGFHHRRHQPVPASVAQHLRPERPRRRWLEYRSDRGR